MNVEINSASAALASWGRRAVPALLSTLLWAASHANAQPTATGSVTPPARSDIALRGQVLATVQVKSHAACQAECKRVAGCTGYNFSGGEVHLPPPRGGGFGGPPTPTLSSCLLMTGGLTDAAAAGVVSCRMPCEAGATTAATGTLGPLTPLQPVTPGRQPGGMQLGPPITPAPPTATVLPAVPPLVIAGTIATPPPPAPPPTPPPPPPPPQRSGISGYEMIFVN